MSASFLVLFPANILYMDFLENYATEKTKNVARNTKNTLKWPENLRNRFQSRNHGHQSRIEPVTNKCYMAWKSGIWHITIPDFQVLAKSGHRPQGHFQGKKMTIQLHLAKTAKIKSNNWKIAQNAWNIRMCGLEKSNFLIFRKKYRKGLQSFFLCGMISVDSYTHFEVGINIRKTRNVTFM